MNEHDWLAQEFEEHRPHLRTVAYRMLGSVTESDDALQEAWLRLSRADRAHVDNLGGWLTTVVGRVCLDMLRSRRARREDYVGSWLPEPVVSLDEATSPEDEALIADSVGLALLVVLETLTPSERLAFVLHDMFAVPFDEIGDDRRAQPGRGPSAREPRSAAGAGRAAERGGRSGPRSASWSTRSSPHPGPETSRRWSPCSIPTSSSARTPGRAAGWRGRRWRAQSRSPAACSNGADRSPILHSRRS